MREDAKRSRSWVRYGLTGAAFGLLVYGAAHAAIPGTLPPITNGPPVNFEIYRGSSDIGRHTVAFARDGENLIVTTEIEMKVKIAFITAFRYEHRAREVWRDGRLVALESTTFDDGKTYFVNAVSREDGLWVEGSSGNYLAPSDTIPSSYWNPAILERDAVLNTQKGDLLETDISKIGSEPRLVDGRRCTVETYRLQSKLSVDIDYCAEDKTWVGLRFAARGAEISYRPDDGVQTAQADSAN
jgi:hypothetical protein